MSQNTAANLCRTLHQQSLLHHNTEHVKNRSTCKNCSLSFKRKCLSFLKFCTRFFMCISAAMQYGFRSDSNISGPLTLSRKSGLHRALITWATSPSSGKRLQQYYNKLMSVRNNLPPCSLCEAYCI